MPGIAGIIEKTERLSGAAAARLLAPLTGPGERVSHHAAGCVAMAHAAHTLPVEQGGIAGDGGLLLAVSGWVAGRDELWRELGFDGETPIPRRERVAGVFPHEHDLRVAQRHATTPEAVAPGATEPFSCRRGLAELCLELYRRRGAESLVRLNGIYALALWETSTQTLILAGDRLGLSGLCYQVEAGRLRFASRPRALTTGRTPELDSRALGQLLTVGYPLGDRTLSRDVRVLGPGSLGIWRDGRMIVQRVWSLPEPGGGGGKRGGGTSGQAVEALSEALAGAVGDALEDVGEDIRLALPLSGGLDSRTLLAEVRHHTRPATYAYGHGHSRDRRYAARMARLVGARHHQIELPRDFMERYGPRLIYLTEGQASLHACHVLSLMPQLARRPCVVLSGFLGDSLTGGHLGWAAAASGTDVNAAGTALFERAYRVAFDDPGLDDLLRRPYARDARGAAQEEFLAVYREGSDPLHRADRVDLELRQRRFVSYQLHGLGAVMPVRVPFADHRFIDTCLGWSPEWRREQLLYKRHLIEKHPDLARVPVTATGLPLAGPAPWIALKRYAERFRWLTLRRLTRGYFQPHDYRAYAHYDAWIRTGARSFFTALLGDRELLDDVFDTEKVADLLKAHLEGRIDAYQRLSAVATVGLWLRFSRRGAAATEPLVGSAAAP